MTGLRLLVAGASAGVTAAAPLLGGLSAKDMSRSAKDMSRGQTPGHVPSGQLAAGFAAGDTQALVLRRAAAGCSPCCRR